MGACSPPQEGHQPQAACRCLLRRYWRFLARRFLRLWPALFLAIWFSALVNWLYAGQVGPPACWHLAAACVQAAAGQEGAAIC